MLIVLNVWLISDVSCKRMKVSSYTFKNYFINLFVCVRTRRSRSAHTRIFACSGVHHIRSRSPLTWCVRLAQPVPLSLSTSFHPPLSASAHFFPLHSPWFSAPCLGLEAVISAGLPLHSVPCFCGTPSYVYWNASYLTPLKTKLISALLLCDYWILISKFIKENQKQ